MNAYGKISRIDWGKWFAVPIFAYVLFLNLMHTKFMIRYFFPVNAMKIQAVVNQLLTASFLVLVIYLYLRRSSAATTIGSYFVRFIAVFAFILPFAIPFFGYAGSPSLAMLAVSNAVMGVGLAIGLAALLALGTSFSIIPQARSLVVRGPYRMVRHPIYLGEIISYAGLAMADATGPKALVVLLLIVCQVYRAIQEEKLLSVTFPEYHDYASKTARFIPGVF